MSEQKKHFSNKATILFVIVICVSCATILSLLSTGLKERQEEAQTLYKSKQLLIAAKLLSYDGYFQYPQGGNTFVNASFQNGALVPAKESPAPATDSEILQVFEKYVFPCLTTAQGGIYSFSSKNKAYVEYVKDNEQYGYSELADKLVYCIYYNGVPQNAPSLPASSYVIPINGFGLWGPIYGYLSLQKDANTIIGTTWYDQEETPGLGGNIGLPTWQQQFTGKKIFQQSVDGTTNFQTAPIGIVVVKTKVSDELGDSPASKSAVDGISGATITEKGVTEAYFKTLENYRAFLIEAHNKGR